MDRLTLTSSEPTKMEEKYWKGFERARIIETITAARKVIGKYKNLDEQKNYKKTTIYSTELLLLFAWKLLYVDITLRVSAQKKIILFFYKDTISHPAQTLRKLECEKPGWKV